MCKKVEKTVRYVIEHGIWVQGLLRRKAQRGLFRDGVLLFHAVAVTSQKCSSDLLGW